MGGMKIIKLSLYFFCEVDYCQCFGTLVLCFIRNPVHRTRFGCNFQIVSFINGIEFGLELDDCCWKKIHCSQKIFEFLFGCLFGELRFIKIVFTFLSPLFASFSHFIMFTIFIEIKAFFQLY